MGQEIPEPRKANPKQAEDSCLVLIQCPDRKGLIFKTAEVFYRHALNIVENKEFVDKKEKMFFTRSVVDGNFSRNRLYEELKNILPPEASVRIQDREKKKILVFVTRESHCLGDLLMREWEGELGADIVAVLSNREKLRVLSERFEKPFHYLPADHFDAASSPVKMSRHEHEESVLKILDGYSFDYLVLAKYMRILTPEFVARFPRRILNIHHSFLPAFIGANPYRQAYERGVKIIGATAHFVNRSLDEGPIIAQDVIPVTHEMSVRQMREAGKDIEKSVLFRALKNVLEERVFEYGNRTVIF